MEVLIKLSDAIKTLKSMAVPLVRKLPSAQPERLTDYSFEESCTECPAYDTENHRCPRFNQVIRTALKDANLEPCENCISRQAAIDALADMHCKSDEDGYVWIIRSDAWARIDALPSVQPEKRTEERTETHACDLIYRQAAITEFSCCELTPDGGIDANYAIDFLKQLPSAQPEQKWIPCSERLPEQYGNYLVSYRTDDFESDIGTFDPDRINSDTGEWSACDANGFYWVASKGLEVIAWMPLPEPYREGE